MSKKSFLEFIKESNLSKTEKTAIQEAWEVEKQNMAAEMRDEFSQRFNDDKSKIVEGIQSMTEEVINEEMEKLYTEKQKLAEDRAILKSKLTEFANFSNEILAEEVKELRVDRAALTESLSKFTQFSSNIIAEEIQEFRDEKQALTEARVKLLAEGKEKINEAKDRFVKRAAQQAADFVQEQTQSELSELKQEINEASKNMFGRKIFEAVATEFKETQYRENEELVKLQNAISILENDVKTLENVNTLLESEVIDTKKTVRIMESQNERSDILNTLLTPLTAEQKCIMESLLEKTPNEMLNEDYNKYLGSVLKQTGKPNKRAHSGARKQLSESTVITGNRKQHIQESTQESVKESVIDDDFEEELNKITNLAGYRK